ncbi:MAG: acetyl-CoA C-acyltransferase [Gracilimonas sp.]|uniref:thiolase family protein n=1 Tax=Gracilimonas TaxID=649462 RepID=UPI001B0F9791|nr:acetyl-CoA C-acyltransferase [Gracilimonas sp.]MBO6585400.1 acetyl-CoA C-acyltransferase [Gracilimonas sp.]MBO6616396.1 acetyl-CoA C-acyltransferase [Gracilimonas sp.]
MSTKTAYIVAAARTACGKANKGSLRFTRPDSMGGEVVKDLLNRTKGLEAEQVEDVIMGCAFPEASQGLNVARQIALLGGLPDSVPGVTVNRFCSSGLQTIAMAAERIMAGGADVIIAGGVESMSLVPMGGMSVQPNPELVENKPGVYVSMGITAENVANKYEVSRQDQDQFAYQSHQRAIKAWEDGKFDSQITPVEVHEKKVTADGEVVEESFTFKQDEGPRKDTSVEALSGLRPVFKNEGSVTAGNSSQMNDAAAGVVVMSGEMVEKLDLKPMARYVGFQVAGVAPQIMGIGPIEAVPKVLNKTGLKLSDIDLIELNEAFASQSLAVIRELGLDQEITNVNGGAIAMGHPLGCTGAKLTTQILYEMKERNSKYGLVTMCIGGGMGAAGIFENL